MRSTIERAKSNLSNLGGLSAVTEVTEKAILAKAEERLGRINNLIDKISAKNKSGDNFDDIYLSLVEERAQLNLIIGRSRKILSS